MREVFADTGYWVALIDLDDTLHESAVRLSRDLDTVGITTSSAVITEVLAHFSYTTRDYRDIVAAAVQDILESGDFMVIHVDRELHWAALKMYRDYRDKQWSHVDCISFILMQNLDITESLSHDIHFRQAGFKTLL